MLQCYNAKQFRRTFVYYETRYSQMRNNFSLNLYFAETTFSLTCKMRNNLSTFCNLRKICGSQWETRLLSAKEMVYNRVCLSIIEFLITSGCESHVVVNKWNFVECVCVCVFVCECECQPMFPFPGYRHLANRSFVQKYVQKYQILLRYG